MKKIVGILSIVLAAVAMFFSANNVNNFRTDSSLADLMNMNVAQAQAEDPPGGSSLFRFGQYVPVTYGGTTYTVEVDVIVNGVKVGTKLEVRTSETYTIWDCKGWNGNC